MSEASEKEIRDWAYRKSRGLKTNVPVNWNLISDGLLREYGNSLFYALDSKIKRIQRLDKSRTLNSVLRKECSFDYGRLMNIIDIVLKREIDRFAKSVSVKEGKTKYVI